MPSSNERRASSRFPVEREVRFRVLNKGLSSEAGIGKTVNISSKGVLFTTNQVLLPGRNVELSINWPALLDNNCPLKLVAKGRVVRFEPGQAALEITSHEFRTAGSKG